MLVGPNMIVYVAGGHQLSSNNPFVAVFFAIRDSSLELGTSSALHLQDYYSLASHCLRLTVDVAKSQFGTDGPI